MKANGRRDSRATGARRALCVGINDYPYKDNDLKGCVNDARAWADTLRNTFGFAKPDVAMLLDKQATKKNVMGALKKLLAGAKSGDVLVFTNSSHGSYVADEDGDEEKYDEILCPFDIDDNHITDDELRNYFSTLPKGVHLTVVLDNCFSGTATRAAVGRILPGMRTPDDRRVRFLNPRLRGLPELQDAWKAKPRSRFPQSTMKDLLLSGCTDKEYSYDARINGTFHGALSYYALDAIRKAKGRLTYAQWHKKIVATIIDYPQNPQLEGAAANKRRMLFT